MSTPTSNWTAFYLFLSGIASATALLYQLPRIAIVLFATAVIVFLWGFYTDNQDN